MKLNGIIFFSGFPLSYIRSQASLHIKTEVVIEIRGKIKWNFLFSWDFEGLTALLDTVFFEKEKTTIKNKKSNITVNLKAIIWKRNCNISSDMFIWEFCVQSDKLFSFTKVSHQFSCETFDSVCYLKLLSIIINS